MKKRKIRKKYEMHTIRGACKSTPNNGPANIPNFRYVTNTEKVRFGARSKSYEIRIFYALRFFPEKRFSLSKWAPPSPRTLASPPRLDPIQPKRAK